MDRRFLKLIFEYEYFFFHWWKWHEKGKNCFKGNMVKSELCWILFDKMKLRRNRNYVENEFSCGIYWNSVVYFFLYKYKIKAFREYDISFIRKNAKSRDFSHHELSVNELKNTVTAIYFHFFQFVQRYSRNVACKSMGRNGLRFYGLSVSGMTSRCT